MSDTIHELTVGQYEEALCAAARIRAVSDAIMQMDTDGDASQAMGLFHGTLFSLADTIAQNSNLVSDILGSTVTKQTE